MNGPEHYRAAEWLLEGITWENERTPESAARVARAQAHATLALVAAQVDAAELDIADEYGTEVVTDWGKAVEKS